MDNLENKIKRAINKNDLLFLIANKSKITMKHLFLADEVSSIDVVNFCKSCLGINHTIGHIIVRQ